jgi:hypothetical protein
MSNSKHAVSFNALKFDLLYHAKTGLSCDLQ